MSTIDISGLDKAAVLAALYNGASPVGLGFIRASMTPGEMTVVEARELLRSETHFDYLNGRSFKVNLGNNTFDPWLYDRDNGGEGTAERIIAQVRQTGAVRSSAITENREQMTAEHEYRQPDYAHLAEIVAPIIGRYERLLAEINDTNIPKPPPNMTSRQYLDWASDQAMRFFNDDPRKSILVFLILVEAHSSTAWIATDPATPMILRIGLHDRFEMEHAMKGFAA